MPKSKWVMLCPMARSGSSHTSELLNSHEGIRSHHGLFNEGPFGRWPADPFIPITKKSYYSTLLNEKYERIGGEEHSGEFLDTYIFTDNPLYNPRKWDCIGFKIQFVHFVHMPDLREYLIQNKDIKIIINTRRHLLEHACAESWCQNGNSRASRPGEDYAFGSADSIPMNSYDVLKTFENLCRYRQYAITLFDEGERDFLEWSYEDAFQMDGSIDTKNHQKLFDFLGMSPTRPLASTFSKTPRPVAKEYWQNYKEIETYMRSPEDGIYAKYFSPDYNPWTDFSWPVLKNYKLERVMKVKNNHQFRSS